MDVRLEPFSAGLSFGAYRKKSPDRIRASFSRSTLLLSEIDARITCRGDGAQFGFHGFRNVERGDERGDGFGGDVGVGTRERLERLVGRGIARAAQYGLDTFCYDGPVVLQIAAQRLRTCGSMPEALRR